LKVDAYVVTTESHPLHLCKDRLHLAPAFPDPTRTKQTGFSGDGNIR
jgi:hypothetical protein